MVHKVHERLGNSVDSPLEGVEEVSQVHRVLYLHGGGDDDDDHDDIYDNFDNNGIYLWYPLPPSSADGWNALPSWRGCCHPGGKFFFIIITLGDIKKRLLKHITKFSTDLQFYRP